MSFYWYIIRQRLLYPTWLTGLKEVPAVLSEAGIILQSGTSLWSRSYFAGSCGSAPISMIRQYIEQQNTPD